MQIDRIAVDGPIKSADGYGHMTENLILAFDRAGYDVYCGTHWSHTDLTHVNPRVQELARRGLTTTPVAIRCSQPDSFQLCPASQYKVGYSMFEFTKMPRAWYAGNHLAHLVQVPSEWCKQVWLEAGVQTPILVNQLGVDTDLFTAYDRPQRDVFTFVMSGTMSERKAPWLAWEAFKLAFPTEQDVRLVMKSPAWLPLPLLDDPRIQTINEVWSKAQMIQLLHDSDCFVYPTRSEGFGLSPCEAMSTGLPVICTDATSCTEFMRPEHSYPLRITGWETVPSHWGDIGAFTCPDRDHLVALMRHVYEQRAEAKQKGVLAAEFIRNNLTWRHNVERFVAAIGGK